MAERNGARMHTHETEGSHPHNDHEHEQDHHHDHPHLQEPVNGVHGGHDHDHDHQQDHGRFGWLLEAIPFLHHHSHAEANIDDALQGSGRGLRALIISLAVLGITAALQLVIVLVSGSVGLLADTIHNFGDALTAVPLGIAFVLGRRAATRRYTYGFGRAEDAAGVLIVAIILFSALIAAYESVQKLLHPEPISHIGWVIVAALVGFAGNEAVAVYRMRVGRQIGSAALVADGQHARADGFTSLAVFVGALGVLAGFPLADPIVGLLITVAILFIVKDTAVTMWRRVMDAVDPSVIETIEHTARGVEGVQGVHAVRARWLGHQLEAEVHVMVDEDLPTRESHHLAEEVRHQLFHLLPRLHTITVHVDPCGHGGEDPHQLTAHHTVTAGA
jgi:cation diffusion facilitator family transporter